jgi:hypothetical protein
MKPALYLFVLIGIIFNQSCFAQKKINWKVYDRNFNDVTEVRASEISIADNLIWFKVKGKYGVMDLHKNILIKPEFEKIYHETGGFTSVGIKYCFGMVYKGKQILPLEYSNGFLVDTSGYIRASQGCSENPEAYIFSRYRVVDRTGKLISQGCEKDIDNMFMELTGRSHERDHTVKRISNGFRIKLMSPNGYVKKGIYNRKDSLIFKCEKCVISDNVGDEFIISQRDLTPDIHYEIYAIDTLGTTKIKGGYSRLLYNKKYDLHLYERGTETGLISRHSNPKALVCTNVAMGIQIISDNRFLVSIPDSLNGKRYTICDSIGTQLSTLSQGWFQVLGTNCLVHKTPAGYIFTDADGKPVSAVYDSVFVIPDFNYIKMVLGDERPRGSGFCGTRTIQPLDRDGFSPLLVTRTTRFYGIARGKKKGLFNVESHTEIPIEYSLVARVDNDLFAAKKAGKWSVVPGKGNLKSFNKSKYITFFENYFAVGN